MLKSLEEHDKERMEAYARKQYTGIACPVCGEEVTKIRPGIVSHSFPPRIPIGCIKCWWQGTYII